jgi:hypothetical protein
MKRSPMLLVFVAAVALAAGPTFAKRNGNSGPGASSSAGPDGQQNNVRGHNMPCSHYVAMTAAAQTAAVTSMRSKMPAASKMPSSHAMATKVAASCRDHPGMMVHEVLEHVMPH